tara:strand:+ start:1460 stop:1723 length:264 start_codon:yes stop_codon:yes gene_type:complete
MLKALMIITILGGEVVHHEVEVPSMEICLEAREGVLLQDPAAKVICVPTENKEDKMEHFFGLFLEMVERIKLMEEEFYINGEGEYYD